MLLFGAFLFLAAGEMLWELKISHRNSRRLLERGAVEIGPRIVTLMTLLYIFLFAGAFAERLLFPKRLPVSWIALFLCLFFLAKALKLWAVSSLGDFWTMRVLIVPETKVVTRGPYRWIRHPNYIAVTMEIAAIALLGKSYWTFFFVFFAFLIVLAFRISQEENALLRYTNYSASMNEKRRFLP